MSSKASSKKGNINKGSSISPLPLQVLLSILAHFPTIHLTQLSLVCRRFASLVCRLLQRRLQAVASLPANDLIFECFTPAAKLTTPSLDCRYIGTRIGGPGRSLLEEQVADVEDGDGKTEEKEGLPAGLDRLTRMYSVFQPLAPNENRRTCLRRTDGSSSQPERQSAMELVYLESEQPFEQLCAITSVGRPGPRPGLYTSHVNINDGVLRLWRDWLTQQSSDLAGSGGGGGGGDDDDRQVLWVDAGRTVGLRMRVMHGPAERMPILYGPDDQPSVSYRLEYQGTYQSHSSVNSSWPTDTYLR